MKLQIVNDSSKARSRVFISDMIDMCIYIYIFFFSEMCGMNAPRN